MKKILTILLTLVMAVCLINLNNSHTKAEDNDANTPFTITATEVGTTTVTLTKISDPGSGYTPPILNFSTNNGESWNTYSYDSGIQITKDQSVMFKSTEDKSLSLNYNDYITITADNKITASGNTMSLVSTNYSNETTVSNYCFAFLFRNCTNLTSIDNLLLPAKTVGEGSYRNMFAGCTGLTSVPVDLLPATTLGVNCYFFMFGDCSNLTNIPNLPATTLANICYECMFIRCSKIKISATKTDNYVIPLKITDSGSASNPTQSMFSATGGTFTSDPVIGTTYYIATKSSQKSKECTDATKCSISATKGTGNIVAHIKKATDDPSPSNVLDVFQFDEEEPKILIKGKDYDLYTGSLTLVLNKSFIDTLGVGTHSIKITYKIGDFLYYYSLNITITGDSPSPSKKDESCEKVIGPTWHWNNTKGICEEYSTVGTYTR